MTAPPGTDTTRGLCPGQKGDGLQEAGYGGGCGQVGEGDADEHGPPVEGGGKQILSRQQSDG